jgi:hypothetical protein
MMVNLYVFGVHLSAVARINADGKTSNDNESHVSILNEDISSL